MTGRFGIDFAWGRPTIAQLRAHGVTFVGRYFSWHEGRGLASPPGKDLSRAELAEYRANGIGVVVAWETTETRALAGEAAGHFDAQRALEQARAVGWHGPIDFAVDHDYSGSEVEPYFRGAQLVAGAQTGAYAGYRPVSDLFDRGLIHHGWQTYAWSAGRWDRRALVRQYSNEHRIGGVDCDYDVEILPAPSPKPVPRPLPTPSPHPPVENLTLLTEEERDAVDSYDHYIKHPHMHVHGLRVVRSELVTLRKRVFAAVSCDVEQGKTWSQAWAVHQRGARYLILKSRTEGLG